MSHDVNDLLQRTADEPTRPLDTAAVVGKAKRQARVARAGAGLGAVAVLALAAIVVLPLLDRDGPGLQIADGPGSEQAADTTAGDEFTLGESYVWRSEPGSFDEAGLAFAAEVLGWEDATIIERSNTVDGVPTRNANLVITNANDRAAELFLRGTDTTDQAVWDVHQVFAGLQEPPTVSEDPSLVWQPGELDTRRYRPFQGVTGVAYIRTPASGTVMLDIDATAVTNAEVPLEGRIDVGDRTCPYIHSTLLLFHNNAGEVVSAVGHSGYGPPADCDPPLQTSDRAPEAGSDAWHWPVELIYTRPDRSSSLTFTGTSWSDWTLQTRTDDGETRLVDREQDGQTRFPDTGDPIGDDRDGNPRGAGPAIHPEWREAVGLDERVVVPLAQIPEGPELVRSLGLDADDVEAYVTPNIITCTVELEQCSSEEGAARAIAHLATGFPLFAEEGRGSDPAQVWLVAESFGYGDAATDAYDPDAHDPTE